MSRSVANSHSSHPPATPLPHRPAALTRIVLAYCLGLAVELALRCPTIPTGLWPEETGVPVQGGKVSDITEVQVRICM
jgi:hypothetical protein